MDPRACDRAPASRQRAPGTRARLPPCSRTARAVELAASRNPRGMPASPATTTSASATTPLGSSRSSAIRRSCASNTTAPSPPLAAAQLSSSTRIPARTSARFTSGGRTCAARSSADHPPAPVSTTRSEHARDVCSRSFAVTRPTEQARRTSAGEHHRRLLFLELVRRRRPSFGRPVVRCSTASLPSAAAHRTGYRTRRLDVTPPA